MKKTLYLLINEVRVAEIFHSLALSCFRLILFRKPKWQIREKGGHLLAWGLELLGHTLLPGKVVSKVTHLIYYFQHPTAELALEKIINIYKNDYCP